MFFYRPECQLDLLANLFIWLSTVQTCLNLSTENTIYKQNFGLVRVYILRGFR